jgi:hypothetical protein
MKKAVLLAAVMVLGLTSAAQADRGSLSDPSEGGSQRIWDIERISHSHVTKSRTNLLRHTVRFYDDVSGTSFDQGFEGPGIQLHFEFNRRKAGPERTAYFGRNPDESLYVVVVGRDDRILGYANWFQPSPEEITIEFPKRLLRPGLKTYKWKATAISGPPCEDTGAPSDGCPDETRWLKHASA